MNLDFSTMVWGWIILGGVLLIAELVIPGAVLGFLGLAALIVAGLLHFDIISGIVDALIFWFRPRLLV